MGVPHIITLFHPLALASLPHPHDLHVVSAIRHRCIIANIVTWITPHESRNEIPPARVCFALVDGAMTGPTVEKVQNVSFFS